MTPFPNCNRRILLVDDNPAIHDDFRRILIADEDGKDLDAEAAHNLSGIAGSRPRSSRSVSRTRVRLPGRECDRHRRSRPGSSLSPSPWPSSICACPRGWTV